jgi:hypothetical protein
LSIFLSSTREKKGGKEGKGEGGKGGEGGERKQKTNIRTS